MSAALRRNECAPASPDSAARLQRQRAEGPAPRDPRVFPGHHCIANGGGIEVLPRVVEEEPAGAPQALHAAVRPGDGQELARDGAEHHRPRGKSLHRLVRGYEVPCLITSQWFAPT
eukprot:1287950-Pyramimonas_sp.AAC.2